MSDMNLNSDSNISGSVPELNVLQRITGIFLSPRNTYEAIDRKPDWIIPIVLILLITLVFTMVTMPIVMPEQMEKQREKMEEKGMSDEQIDNALETGQKIGKIMGPISAIVGTIIMLLIFTLIVWFVGNIVLGGQTTFKKIFSVYVYASLIGILGQLVMLPLIITKGTANIHFSLASLLSDDQSKTVIYQILKQIGLFPIWHYIVLAIGFSVVYKFSMKKAGGAIFVLFLVFAAFTVAISQLFG